jgi:hypothetical protein
MANAHNCMIRGLNALILQCQHVVLSRDKSDLLFFAAAWAAWIMDHHRLEEQIMFPGFESVLNAPGALGTNVDQHHAFSAALKDLEIYAKNTGPEQYDAGSLKGKLDKLAGPLCEHLKSEVPTLLHMRELCGDDAAKAQKLLDVYRASEAEAAKQDKFIVPPMVMGLRDKTFEGGNGWPLIPGGIVSEFVIANVLGWMHAGAWRFLPCDFWGRPRGLPSVG